MVWHIAATLLQFILDESIHCFLRKPCIAQPTFNISYCITQSILDSKKYNSGNIQSNKPLKSCRMSWYDSSNSMVSKYRRVHFGDLTVALLSVNKAFVTTSADLCSGEGEKDTNMLTI